MYFNRLDSRNDLVNSRGEGEDVLRLRSGLLCRDVAKSGKHVGVHCDFVRGVCSFDLAARRLSIVLSGEAVVFGTKDVESRRLSGEFLVDVDESLFEALIVLQLRFESFQRM